METVELDAADYNDLRTAFSESSYDTECYLDTREGEVLWLSARAVAVDEEPQPDAPEWKREAFEKRRLVWEDDSGRFLRIPPADRSDVRGDIEAFLEEEAGPSLKDRFGSERPTRQSFEPFERALERDPEARAAWESYRRSRIRERIDEWLELKGYELEVASDESGED